MTAPLRPVPFDPIALDHDLLCTLTHLVVLGMPLFGPRSLRWIEHSDVAPVKNFNDQVQHLSRCATLQGRHAFDAWCFRFGTNFVKLSVELSKSLTVMLWIVSQALSRGTPPSVGTRVDKLISGVERIA